MLIAGAAALFSTTVAAAPFFLREVPPPAHTGGFGEPTCAQCHLSDGADPPPAALRVLGLPAAYSAGQRYSLVVQLVSPSLQVGGFQLSARFGEGSSRGRQAGRFVMKDQRVALTRVDSTGIEYVSHNLLSIGATHDTLRWSVTWIAPASARTPVDFHVAANVSNDDVSALGDYILTRSIRAQPRAEKIDRSLIR